MSATDELRDGLRARGVEVRYSDERTTYWYGELDGSEWGTWTAVENDGLLHVSFSDEGDFLAPQEVIAATLGAEICKQEERGWSTEGDHARVWLTCGHDCMVETVADLPNFCPICGAKVVDA